MAIEMQKIVVWAIGIVVALVLIAFMYSQLAPGTEGSLTNTTIGTIFDLGP